MDNLFSGPIILHQRIQTMIPIHMSDDLIIPAIILGVLAFPVVAVAALVKVNRLTNLVWRIEQRLELLEHHSRSTSAAGPQAAAAPPPGIQPEAAAPIISQPPSSTPPPQAATRAIATPSPPLPRQPIGFEERFGTRWVVWVGGVALALGGVFLVRYTIQQGLIGPRVRIFLGGVLAAILVALGEWTRRTDRLSKLPSLSAANIPSILTAAGVTVAYATVYAAYGLYHFLPPAIAFVLLGAVALLTLAAALLHGPALAGLGLVGAFLAPILVASQKPDYWSLYIYLAVVTAAALALARVRLSRWLAIATIMLSAAWIVPGLQIDSVDALGAHVFHALAGFGLAATFLVCGLLYGPPAAPGEVDRLSTLALSVYLLLAAILVLASRHDAVALAAFAVLTVTTVVIAWRTEAAAGAVPVAAVLAMAVMGHWALQTNLEMLLAPSGPTAPAIPEPARFLYGSHLLLAGAWAALFGIAGFLQQGRGTRALPPMLWGGSAVFAPLAMLIALYYRIAGVDRSLPFAALALLLAAIFGVATDHLVKRESRPGLTAAGAMFATGTLAALALALTFALEKGWLTVGLALMVPAAAWVAEQRPLPWLRWLAALVVGIVVVRIAHEPRIAGTDLGTTPIFNWLLYGYGVPAVAFWAGGFLLRKRADDVPARMVDAGAILFTVLLAMLEIRHYVTGGDLYRPVTSSTEAALDVNAGLAVAIGLEWIRGRTRSIVHNVGALTVAALTFVAIISELVLVAGPRFNNAAVGGVFFNLILLGYGIPAILAITLALTARATRPMPYRIVAAITAVTLALFYLTLQVRRLFHGPILAGPTTDAEQYCYSTIWLAFGIALLAAGFALRSQPARLLALGVIALTVAKVFIIDTASISGIYRALSVIGLGVVLLGIGWLYQHLLYPRLPSTAATPSANPAP